MLNNTRDAYGFVSKFFHWSMALIILGLLLLGYYLDELSYSANQFTFLKLHKSFGLLILWLVALRIIWHRLSKKPKSLPNHAKWERILSKITHVFLYAALIGMPLSGWIMSMSGGYPVAFFGIEIPSYIDKNATINKVSWAIHENLALAMIIGVFLHGCGAIKHHFLDKDSTLKRMLFAPEKFFLVLILSLFIIFIGGLVRFFLL